MSTEEPLEPSYWGQNDHGSMVSLIILDALYVRKCHHFFPMLQIDCAAGRGQYVMTG